MSEAIRTFLAINLPEEIIDSLKKISELIRNAGLSGIKFSPQRSMHCTVKFLGNIHTDQLSLISRVL